MNMKKTSFSTEFRVNPIKCRALSLALLIAVFASMSFSPVWAEDTPKATISQLSGQVRFKNPGDTEWKTAEKGTELFQGAQIFAGENSECDVVTGNSSKSVTKIKQETRVVLTTLGDNAQISVTSGEVFSLFKRVDAKSTFKVVSPTAVAAARGTAFSFAAEGIGSEISNTVEVYDHTVGLSPVDAPDKEILVNEGQGVVMGFDGVVEKQFEVNAEDMKAAREFMQQAVEVLSLEKPTVENITSSESRTDEPKKNDDNQNYQGGTPPPGSPPGGPTDGSGGTTGHMGGGFDSAMDGVMQRMAGESEMSQANAFAPGSMSQMVSNLSDLSHGMQMPEGATLDSGATTHSPGNFDVGAFAEAMKSAFQQSDYFQNQTPEVQQQMAAYMGSYVQNIVHQVRSGFDPNGPPIEGYQPTMGHTPTEGVPAGSAPYTGPGSMPTPHGGVVNTGGQPYTGGGYGLGPFELSTKDFIPNPNELPQFKDVFRTPEERQNAINFIQAIRDNYNASPGNLNPINPRIIENFHFTNGGVAYVGSISYKPTHEHGATAVHAENIVVSTHPTDPTAPGTQVTGPPTSTEIPRS